VIADLGLPAMSPPAPPHTSRQVPSRRNNRQLTVGNVPVGSDAPVSVQSITTTLTADVNATLHQIAELTAAGCQIVRVAVPSQDDADALPVIAGKSGIPVIADIHFQPRYVFAAIDAGCAAVRVNPGNIKKFDDKVREIAAAAVPIRIGVNAGSLDPRLLTKHGGATPRALVESALWECSLFEEHGFTDIKISVKHHDPATMVAAYRLLASACDYPLHLGVTGPVRGSVRRPRVRTAGGRDAAGVSGDGGRQDRDAAGVLVRAWSAPRWRRRSPCRLRARLRTGAGGGLPGCRRPARHLGRLGGDW
jgi:(E)-4-hydroxy-3-methylbut-2-enyl-diphosphate synthase